MKTTNTATINPYQNRDRELERYLAFHPGGSEALRTQIHSLYLQSSTNHLAWLAYGHLRTNPFCMLAAYGTNDPLPPVNCTLINTNE